MEMRMLARDGVPGFYAATFGGFDLQTHFLAERSRKEAAHGVGLPAGGFHQFGQGRALGLFQKGDDAGALAGLAGRGGLGLGAAFRRLLAPARLAGRLCFCGRGRWLSGRRACFTRFCRLGSGCGLILLLCSHEFDCSLGGSYRSHDIHGSDGAAHQAKSEPCTRASWETAEGRRERAQSPRISLSKHARWWSQRGSRAIVRKVGSVRNSASSAERNRTYSWMAGARCTNIMIWETRAFETWPRRANSA